MKQPDRDNGEDDLIWGPDPKGRFSIKSAYEVLVAASNESDGLLWKTVWQWQGHETLISWIPPPDDWLKVNTDGSVIHPHSLAAAGGIIHDFQGRAIDGFSANLGACSIMRAELLAAEIGLSRAWDLGAKKVILELDSLAAVLSIQEPSEWDTRHGPTLRQIQLLRSRDWQVVV
ncbi:Putative ribonuclease H protein At1g65750 [Linum perenne]